MKQEVRSTTYAYYLRCHRCGTRTDRHNTPELLKEYYPEWKTLNGNDICPECFHRLSVFNSIRKQYFDELPFEEGCWYFVDTEEQRVAMNKELGIDDFRGIEVGSCGYVIYHNDNEKDSEEYSVIPVEDFYKSISRLYDFINKNKSK